MTHEELEAMLKISRYPVTYSHFKTSPKPPFLVYIRTQSDNFAADNKAYSKLNSYKIELYNSKKDIEVEKIIENIFDENNIFYTIDEVWIDSEKLYQVSYEISI
ncbi:hypothetical protein [Clostridium cadaveris]|uniref:hypothetical protein n=1 Tax=Clostridium cadaveris TaxID=1529 RepID=UPI0015B3955F|nr:hypothetical protein [Clostridium cadaveris]NWK10406.1 hypothetical protein [Clostridium cadaveris]